ncbi:MAG: DUF5615 family PIN-like protein [Chloroflexi bacterium]|nr:DUF5615 family PIN-like protein [Chloroflexota bacterium]
MRIRQYLLDENVDPTLKTALHQQWPEMAVWRIGDPGAPPHGALDPDILLWCENNDFSLVTNNRASMPIHLRDHLLAGRHVPGIFILHNKMSLGETVDELALIWLATEPDEYTDLISFLPVSE